MPLHSSRLARNANHLDRMEKAFKLRANGYTQLEIAKEMGMTQPNVCVLLKEAFFWKKEQLSETAEEWRQKELDICDQAVKALMPQVEDGDVKAINSLMTVLGRRSKYLGLDAQVKQEIAITDSSSLSDLKTKLLSLVGTTETNDNSGSDPAGSHLNGPKNSEAGHSAGTAPAL